MKKSMKVTQSYLNQLERDKWFSIRMQNDSVSAQLEKLSKRLKNQRVRLEEGLKKKQQRLQAGDVMPPDILKTVKVYFGS